jgi:hypothetical protein
LGRLRSSRNGGISTILEGHLRIPCLAWGLNSRMRSIALLIPKVVSGRQYRAQFAFFLQKRCKGGNNLSVSGHFCQVMCLETSRPNSSVALGKHKPNHYTDAIEMTVYPLLGDFGLTCK